MGVEAAGINACPCAQGLVRGRASERLLEAVGERQLGAVDDSLEHAAWVDEFELDGIAGLGDRLDGGGVGSVRADHDAVGDLMGAEDVMWAGVLAPYEALEIWSGG